MVPIIPPPPKTKAIATAKGNLLSVADFGPGIPTEEKKAVFEKFYRIGNENTRSAKGTGLGLYLCKKIAKHHHAEIMLTDNHPSGAVFSVLFPAKK